MVEIGLKRKIKINSLRVHARVFIKSETQVEATRKQPCVSKVNRHNLVCQDVHAYVYKTKEKKEQRNSTKDLRVVSGDNIDILGTQ